MTLHELLKAHQLMSSTSEINLNTPDDEDWKGTPYCISSLNNTMSGLVLVAKTKRAFDILKIMVHREFEDSSIIGDISTNITLTYRTICVGKINEEEIVTSSLTSPSHPCIARLRKKNSPSCSVELKTKCKLVQVNHSNFNG